LLQARLSLKTNETPVGCVLVHDGRVVARGMNATNITRNGTRHAELMALTALLSFTPEADMEEAPNKKPKRKSAESNCTLYVTVEPCVMCASMLRQYGIRKVYFGAVNDKFGGTGGVFCIHMNSDPAHAATAPATPGHRPAEGGWGRDEAVNLLRQFYVQEN
ncbi:cytidine deaminase-like protein, partial [Cryphonectria parasitica EP155]